MGIDDSPQGRVHAFPETVTPALPAVGSFADLAMPAPLLTTLGHDGVTVPFAIQGATPDSAGITRTSPPVRSGEAELSRITGAQAPSGVPLVITAPVVERTRRVSSPSPDRRGLTDQGRPVGAEVRRRAQRRPANDSAA